MKFVVYLIIFTIIVYVKSNPEKRKYPAIEDVIETIVSNSHEMTEDIGHKIFKKSISLHPDGIEEEPCRLTLPTYEDISVRSQDADNDDGFYYQSLGTTPPKVPTHPFNIPLSRWTPYDHDYLAQEPVEDNEAYMPYVHSNPIPPVRFLPPVYTRVHEKIPGMLEGNDVYDFDGLSDNEVYPPYVRAVRSRDEDYLDQLEHDAVMPNILPTMPFPFMRSAIPVNYQQHPSQEQQSQGVPVVFPGPVPECALPFLLRCTPQITYGALTQNDYGGYPKAPSMHRKENPIHKLEASYRKENAAAHDGPH